jgi:hypothetical protein
MNDITSALFDAYDIRNALSKKILNKPKDNDGSDITIGDCLDDIITFLESHQDYQKTIRGNYHE